MARRSLGPVPPRFLCRCPRHNWLACGTSSAPVIYFMRPSLIVLRTQRRIHSRAVPVSAPVSLQPPVPALNVGNYLKWNTQALALALLLPMHLPVLVYSFYHCPRSCRHRRRRRHFRCRRRPLSKLKAFDGARGLKRDHKSYWIRAVVCRLGKPGNGPYIPILAPCRGYSMVRVLPRRGRFPVACNYFRRQNVACGCFHGKFS